nr:copia protein [Tanacetum cinerariifolium]GEW92831.1 copia protein [Tanacetum cinerariifolium]
MIIKKDSKIVKGKGERRSLALEVKKESSDEECLTFRSEDEEYVMAVRDFKKFFKRRGRCGDPNHIIGECLKPPKDKNQRAFIRGFWIDSGEEDDERLKTKRVSWLKHQIRVFGSKCFILNTKDYHTKFDPKSYESVFLGYSQNSKAYIILNKHNMKIKESLNVTFDETPLPSKTSPLVDDDLDEEEAIKVTKKNLENDIEDKTLEIDEVVNIKESRNHPSENIIGNLNQRTLSFINEEVYIAQPPGFIDFKKPDHVYKLKKSLYGLKQELKAWPDIMFSVCLCSHFQEDPKTSHLEAAKHVFRYIKVITHLGLWYPKGTCMETVVYVDSDHAGDYVNRKSISGIYMFVGCYLTSWFSKKQTSLDISTTEAEYVSAGKACQQALWIKQAFIDYDIRLDDVPIMCGDKGAIDLSKNPVQHSRNKHIEIRHHFLCDNVQKGHISIKKVSFFDNIADILTKCRC